MTLSSPPGQGKTRLLITAVGSLVATNLLEVLTRMGRERFYLIGTNSAVEAANLFACDVAYITPPSAAGDDYLAALAAIAAQEQPELWIPARDDEVLALARLAEQQRVPGQMLLGSLRSAEIICDKWLSYGFALEHGLSVAPTANTLAGALALAECYGWPLIVKPRRGYGSIGARFVTHRAQLERAMILPGMVAQRPIALEDNWNLNMPDGSDGWPLWYSYTDPAQYASQWVVAPDGEAIEMGASVHTMICGRPERSQRVDDPKLSAVGAGYARSLAQVGWRGPIHTQCRRDAAGEYLMVELAGRLTGGLGGRDMLGVNELDTVLATRFPDRFRPTAEPNRMALSLKQVHTVGIDRAALAQLDSTGVWRRSC